eukprot:7148254-Lingulodinium_polyedra.AAC.1
MAPQPLVPLPVAPFSDTFATPAPLPMRQVARGGAPRALPRPGCRAATAPAAAHALDGEARPRHSGREVESPYRCR